MPTMAATAVWLHDASEIKLVAVKTMAWEETAAHLRPARALGWTGGAVEVLGDGGVLMTARC